jgi:hypothetical protein
MPGEFTLVMKKADNSVTIDCTSEEHRKHLQTRYEMKGFTRVNKEHHQVNIDKLLTQQAVLNQLLVEHC